MAGRQSQFSLHNTALKCASIWTNYAPEILLEYLGPPPSSSTRTPGAHVVSTLSVTSARKTVKLTTGLPALRGTRFQLAKLSPKACHNYLRPPLQRSTFWRGTIAFPLKVELSGSATKWRLAVGAPTILITAQPAIQDLVSFCGGVRRKNNLTGCAGSKVGSMNSSE